MKGCVVTVQKESVKRGVLFVVGMFFISLGIAFIKYTELGISPISSVANILSIRFTNISFGMWTFITNVVLILVQIVMMRKEYSPLRLLQFPLCYFGGTLTDFGLWIAQIVPIDTYFAKIVMVFVGILVLGFGISISVAAKFILYPGEAVVKDISDKISKNFGTVKVYFDVSCVMLSIILSVLLFGGKIYGTREATLLSAVCTGFAVKFWNRLLFKKKAK